jgi:copper chaperone CopZ
MTIRNERLSILGMRCAGCETAIEDALSVLPGVRSAKANHIGACVDISFDDSVTRLSQVLAVMEDRGYGVTWGGLSSPAKSPSSTWFWTALKTLVLFLLVGGVAFWGKSLMPGLMMHMQNPQAGYAMILLVGFLTGFHCIGMCGGFVVSYSAAKGDSGKGARLMDHLTYGAGKTLSYGLLGAAFGAVGALITITPFMRGTVAVAAGLFLVLYGLRMLKLPG